MKLLIFIFFIWRIGLFIIAWIGEKILPFTPRFPYSEIYLTSSGLPEWIWSFAGFDGVHYLGIAQKGYFAQYTQVFFPLYPLLLGFIKAVLPVIPLLLSGIVLSNCFFLLALMMFYKLLQMDFENRTAIWAVLYILAFPVSYFYGSVYTEGLFFFLLVSSFYYSRKKKMVAGSRFWRVSVSNEIDRDIFVAGAIVGMGGRKS